MNPRTPFLTAARLSRQSGVTLFITLIALVAMTLAAIAMMRSIDTGNIIAGNMALKQGASHESDRSGNFAFNYLDSNGALLPLDLKVNQAAYHYYASLQPDVERPFGIPDVLETVPAVAGLPTNAATGNTVNFVIERMCTTTGPWAGTTCIASPFGMAESGGDVRYIGKKLRPPQALYRVSVKVSGPKSVATYTQMVMNATQ